MTAHITTVEGYGALPAGHVRRRAPHGRLDYSMRWPSSSSTSSGSRSCASAMARTFATALRSAAQNVRLEQRDGLVDLGDGHAQLVRRELGVVELLGEAPHRGVAVAADGVDDRAHVVLHRARRRRERADLVRARVLAEALDAQLHRPLPQPRDEVVDRAPP